MKIFKALALVLAVALGHFASAQDIQWASRLIFQYNNYGEDDFSGNKLLGPPDAAPYGRLSRNAFRLNAERAYGTITLGYDRPIHVSQILIIENFLPNRIAKVMLSDTAGTEHTIYEPDKKVINIPSRVLAINIEKTPYLVKEVSIHFNTLDKPGWAQIDAVGISEKALSRENVDDLVNLDGLSFEETMKFMAEKEKLSRNINSAYPEAKPILSPDGRTLYFVRQNAPGNQGGKADEQDIYYSDLINGRWTVARNIGKPLNDHYPNGICSISPDGNTIYVLNAYGENGDVKDGISMSHRQPDGSWSNPEKLQIKGFVNYNRYQDYYMSASGNTLIMAIQTDDTYGDQDLYISFKENDSAWTVPQNLGRIINTENIEYAPFLSSDEKILYFSSNGHAPQPESDIYYAKRLDDSWLNWSRPKNIGFEINTPGWDSYFAIAANSKYAYFVSTDGQIAENNLDHINKDIYRIPLDIEPEPEKVIKLAGKVTEKGSHQPLYAKIQVTSSPDMGYEGFTMTNSKTGDFSIKIPEKNNFFISVEAEGYLTFVDNINIEKVGATKEITKYIELDPMLIGQKFKLNNLFFEQSEATVLPESFDELDKLYDLLTRYPDMVIELGGYTDRQGYRSANKRLSRTRADAVRNYLINRGIHKKRIKAVGYGSENPIAPNDTEENRAKNRRVEVTILDI